LRAKDAYASAVARELVERRDDDLELARFVVGCLREFCDFGMQDGAHGSRDAELLPWWRAFVGEVERVGKLVVDRREALSVDRTLLWVERAVVLSLSMIVTCYSDPGERLLSDWIDSAKPRLSPRHLAAIREFRYAYYRGEYGPTRRGGMMDTLTRHADASRPGPGTRSVKRSVLGARVSTAPPAPFMAGRGVMRPEAGSTSKIDTEQVDRSRRWHRDG
jgi:hypothetical protein